MRVMNMQKAITKRKLLLAGMLMAALWFVPAASAAVPGITGPTFNLSARAEYVTQPDGSSVYSWGYGCSGTPGFAPSAITRTFCSNMQIPGPTLIVNQGDTVVVNLTNNLPNAAGNTSILFPGFNVTSSGAGSQRGLLTQEAVHGGTVTYTFTATTPGTRAYYSGTQGDLQVEMGMYGAIIVLPATAQSCPAHSTYAGVNNAGTALVAGGEDDFRLATSAYDHV